MYPMTKKEIYLQNIQMTGLTFLCAKIFLPLYGHPIGRVGGISVSPSPFLTNASHRCIMFVEPFQEVFSKGASTDDNSSKTALLLYYHSLTLVEAE
jgi:hypothetical protein